MEAGTSRIWVIGILGAAFITAGGQIAAAYIQKSEPVVDKELPTRTLEQAPVKSVSPNLASPSPPTPHTGSPDPAENVDQPNLIGAREWKVSMKIDTWQWAADWINDECAPSDLSGIELMVLQKGNRSSYNFYVFCRVDNSQASKYELDMHPFEDNPTFLSAIDSILTNPNQKLGPEYYSANGYGGGVWYVKKVTK